MFKWILKRKRVRPASKKRKKRLTPQKKQARELVLKLLNECNSHYNFPFKRVFIRAQKTRWGSCSSRGNLNFNYKIIFLPEHIARYIVIHELCHLKEFNHSKRFWDLVRETCPQFEKDKKELEKISLSLR